MQFQLLLGAALAFLATAIPAEDGSLIARNQVFDLTKRDLATTLELTKRGFTIDLPENYTRKGIEASRNRMYKQATEYGKNVRNGAYAF